MYERGEPRRSERSELGQANHAARFTNVTKLRGPTHLKVQGPDSTVSHTPTAPAPAHASTEHVHSSSAQPGTPEPHTRREPAVSAASLRLALPHCPQMHPHSLSASTTSMESRVELLGHPQRGASCGQRLAVQSAPCESTHARARLSGMHDSVHTQPSTDHSSHITSSCYHRTTISNTYMTDMSLSNRTYICDPSASPDLPPPDKTN